MSTKRIDRLHTIGTVLSVVCFWVIPTVYAVEAGTEATAVSPTPSTSVVSTTPPATTVSPVAPVPSVAPVAQEDSVKRIPNRSCLKCHGDEDDKTVTRKDGTQVNIFVNSAVLKKSVHGERFCTDCHTNVTQLPHPEPQSKAVSCINCHEEQWTTQKSASENAHPRLDVVVQKINDYMHSVHARPNKADQSRTNAACYDCHDAHNIGGADSQVRAEHRLKNPEVCGKCHTGEKLVYLTSIHGKENAKGNSKAAVCSDCHTTHNIDSPKTDAVKLSITQNCGSCHKEEEQSYLEGYHGQVNKLGYTHTAKCFDCHGGHVVKGVEDPASLVHPNNRQATCQQCHQDAPQGFLGYHPHGNTHDFSRYPGMWLAAKFMKLLIIGVFLFFWTHLILWFYREYKDRKEGKGPPPEEHGTGGVHFRRFSAIWRILHLFFALCLMILVLTGTALVFSHTAWAKNLMIFLGGPKSEAIIHRTTAVLWLSLFVVHLLFVIRNIVQNYSRFRWFGPTSMVPNWQDLWDVIAMFRWFLGKAPRPQFDRWSYWQKFDYWAPFWGVSIIGFSGVLLFFPTKTALFLPGWIFNISTIVHAEEALLATVFLFTVHFFNAHFRPDKFPMSITIFTGSVPLEEFQHEHALEYQRLKESGELDQYLVPPPSRRVVIASTVLSALLIAAGLTLLILVLIGYMSAPN